MYAKCRVDVTLSDTEKGDIEIENRTRSTSHPQVVL